MLHIELTPGQTVSLENCWIRTPDGFLPAGDLSLTVVRISRSRKLVRLNVLADESIEIQRIDRDGSIIGKRSQKVPSQEK
jgi:hypothetical protein